MKHLLYILISLLPLLGIAQVNVYDINKSFKNNSSSDPNYLTIYEEKLFFQAYDTAHGEELWVVNPTTGESMIADINPSNSNSGQHGGCPIYGFRMAIAYVEALRKEALFYVYNDGIHGNELFRYDGVNPPVLIKEFLVGGHGIASVCASDLITINDTVFVYDPNTGIWKYNVNTNDTRKIANSTYPVRQLANRLFEFNGDLYINGEDTSNTNRLYVYNKVKNSMELKFSINDFNHAQVINNMLYFVAGNVLYQYDGVNSPKTIASSTLSPVNGFTQCHIGEYKGNVYFQAPNVDLYEYNPTTDKTRLIAKSTLDGPLQPDGFIECDGKMYFSASDSTHGRELWEWDGVNMPKMAADIIPLGSNSSSSPFDFRVIDDELYFIAYSGIDNAVGIEVHRYRPQAVSVQNISFDGEVKLFPNPVSNNATLEITLNKPQALSVEVYSMDGKKAIAIPETDYPTGKNNVNISTSIINTGTYFYHVLSHDGKQLAGGKFIKQ